MGVQALFKKPKDVRYVDMAICIDNEFYTEDRDINKLYSYMYLLAYMLACKKRYFSDIKDYEEFASFLAYCTFQRMDDPRKVKIKSVLNYMKSIINFRRMMFESYKCKEIIDPAYNNNWDSVEYVNNMRSSLEISNHTIIEDAVNEVISCIPQLIYKYIPTLYKIDKAISKNIYKSCMLTLIDKFTLPYKYESKLEEKFSSPSFDVVDYYAKHTENEVILWHLDASMKSVIMIIVNKIDNYLTKELHELSCSNDITDGEMSWIVASSFGGALGETNS